MADIIPFDRFKKKPEADRLVDIDAEICLSFPMEGEAVYGCQFCPVYHFYVREEGVYCAGCGKHNA